jgi:hypothetical protein
VTSVSKQARAFSPSSSPCLTYACHTIVVSSHVLCTQGEGAGWTYELGMKEESVGNGERREDAVLFAVARRLLSVTVVAVCRLAVDIVRHGRRRRRRRRRSSSLVEAEESIPVKSTVVFLTTFSSLWTTYDRF